MSPFITQEKKDEFTFFHSNFSVFPSVCIAIWQQSNQQLHLEQWDIDLLKLMIQPLVSCLMGLHLSTVFKPIQNYAERRDCILQQGTSKLHC